mmetsp:Transcript_28034/g.51058  ORF Transcript_28034/g.51058 Transcript_28034/m.51058 type:complete len:92 (-) Transcript_28034:234-509(-)|eukprot:CAMPEP_0198289804 /NCGR_PEP_ID=MMETSP1449-20131203/7873_1 /TAXON_ID=420275 /ORGANISM="Attheya septentrionalis, Strain CCMP2084" /LENGTH=91 /DNA_ID=CAMNT_0043988193 /DNA_START=173 /DNA_END=448 /DNA_ORIENTATION=+
MAVGNLLINLTKPTFYRTTAQGVFTSLGNYYKPMIRSSSVTPLWHMMIFTSVVMYSSSYIALKGGPVQAKRAEQKLALAEYYEKHGHSDHH